MKKDGLPKEPRSEEPPVETAVGASAAAAAGAGATEAEETPSAAATSADSATADTAASAGNASDALELSERTWERILIPGCELHDLSAPLIIRNISDLTGLVP